MSKVSYIQLLKEAISEYDAKAMDYKGPLSEPILTFNGEGELDTHKDASSILERYYFNEKQEKLVEQQDEIGPENPVDVDPEDDAEDPNDIITGEEPDDVDATMDDFEDEILDEDIELEGLEEDIDLEGLEEELQLEDWEESDGAPAGNEPDAFKPEPLDDDDAKVMNQEMISLENTVIEKLIQEMENEVPRDEEAGEEAGTDKSEKEVDNVLEDDFDLLEAELELEAEEADDKKDEDDNEEPELDVDKEIGDEEPVKKENHRLGPINPGSDHEIQEAFRIFEQEIEDAAKEKDEDEDKEGSEEDEDNDEEKKS